VTFISLTRPLFNSTSNLTAAEVGVASSKKDELLFVEYNPEQFEISIFTSERIWHPEISINEELSNLK
jgi:hypothetical protein